MSQNQTNDDDFEIGDLLYLEMTDDEDDKVDAFFATGDFIAPNAVNHSGSNFEHVWEDFTAAEAYHNANPGLHVYTVLTSDNETYNIVNGWHYVNRDGYLFSKKNAGLPQDEQLRIR